MIGDWLRHAHYESPCKVVAISTDITIQFEAGARLYEELKFVEPIPLTPEILEKNFEKHTIPSDRIHSKSEFWYFADEKHTIWIHFYASAKIQIDSKERERNTILKKGLAYVHELQHALKLCGIEKEIEL